MTNNLILIKSLLLAGLVSCCLSACDLLDPKEEIPAYLTISNATVLENKDNGFYSSLGLRDAWVFQGDDLLGAFELPVTIPYYPSNGDELLILGGVFETGFSSARQRYPFWQTIEVPATAAPLDTIKLEPTFEYYPDTVLNYAFVEDFEDATIQFEPVAPGNDLVSLVRISDDVYEGSRAGKAVFDDAQRQLVIQTTESFTLPQRGSNDAYVEITYKNTMPFQVGLFYDAPNSNSGEQSDEILFFSDGEWKTLYVHINNLARMSPENSQFRFFIRSLGGGKEGYIIFDNIRLIHFR